MPLKWLSPQKTGLLSGVWWSHTTNWERLLKISHMYPWNVFVFFRSDMSQPWSYASRLSMSIDLFYWSPIQKCLKSHLIWRLLFTVAHAVCLKGYDDVWGCEFRIKNSVFQGLAFSSGISPLRGYSQQHSGSQWKCTLGCIAEKFWVAKHSSF